MKTAYVWEDIGVKDSFTFGRYPQTASGDDETPIRWVVTETDGRTAALVSRYVLDRRRCYPYLNENGNACFRRWEDTELRSWLQTEFVNKAFSDAEKAVLLPVPGVDGGPDDTVSLPENGDAGYMTDHVYAITPACRRDDAGTLTWWTRLEGPGRHSQIDQYAVDGKGEKCFRPACEEYGVRPVIRISLPDAAGLADGLEKYALPVMTSVPAPGDPVSLGRWPGTGGKLIWTVLDTRDGAALLLLDGSLEETVYDLQEQWTEYPDESEYVPWITCSLRTRLNGYADRLFTEEEKAAIIGTMPEYDPAIPETQTPDRLFLLSEEEAKRYLPLLDRGGCRETCWWLRSHIDEKAWRVPLAEAVYPREEHSFRQTHDAVMNENGVRPAVWVRTAVKEKEPE